MSILITFRIWLYCDRKFTKIAESLWALITEVHLQEPIKRELRGGAYDTSF